MKRFFLSAMLVLLPLLVSAQHTTLVEKLETDVPGQGCISIEADARLDSLIGHLAASDAQIKAIGYRVQVYAGNNTRDARTKAMQAENEIKELFPELPVYTVFKSPRWLCMAGDFLSYEEAYDMMRQIKKETNYKALLILRNQEIKLDY